MARRTKKVGITGKFGPRYGVTVRKRIKDVSRHRQKAQKCPECQHSAVRRESTGIWKCRHCGLVFAAAAYSTRIREFKKDQATMLEYEEIAIEEQPETMDERPPVPEEMPEPVEEEIQTIDEPEAVDEEPIIEEEEQ